MSHRSAAHRSRGPRVIIFGVWIVIAAQYWPGVPIAGAVAVCAWGTALCSGRNANLALTLLIYAPLAALAAAAQLHETIESASHFWRVVTAIDAAAAVILMLALMQYTGEKLTRPQP